ncbi:PREDICTED: uncharacterized protein LOC109159534 [Ipomoea nil]|uniref:uncharacterized protein LOC109159534 n=1 Tax=Ipomoea nil TaxID=35883 RepID=UPI000900F9BE|nr:PREDICTED: uncharacterized protein LOC109159534 [Ipomoea nil]
MYVCDCGLQDFGYSSYQYTWQRSMGAPNIIEEKLDRVLVSETWLELYDGATATSMPCPYSDHLPIMLSPIVVSQPLRWRRFTFDNMWLREDVFPEVVEQSWSKSIGHDIIQRIEMCSHDVERWGARIIDSSSCELSVVNDVLRRCKAVVT